MHCGLGIAWHLRAGTALLQTHTHLMTPPESVCLGELAYAYRVHKRYGAAGRRGQARHPYLGSGFEGPDAEMVGGEGRVTLAFRSVETRVDEANGSGSWRTGCSDFCNKISHCANASLDDAWCYCSAGPWGPVTEPTLQIMDSPSCHSLAPPSPSLSKIQRACHNADPGLPTLHAMRYCDTGYPPPEALVSKHPHRLVQSACTQTRHSKPNIGSDLVELQS
ncbi:hypothetical protein BKA66DRAFT_127553 [Pyrenochaeta sp. MPI-SDFR-AT-0127]|nr:hypothetical protein BKA66DRAFT_127553 [Pyrenochaeta sp. MPI-SDFR-AT-0127]